MGNKGRIITQSMHMMAILVIALTIASWPSLAGASDSNRQVKKEGDAAARQHDIVQGPHVEGHIAFLHAELGITDEQEPLWAPVAAAMRQDVQSLQETQDRVAGQTRGRLNAIQYLQNRVLFAKLRAQGEERFLQALQPLYEKFSDRQKQMADELLIPGASDEHP